MQHYPFVAEWSRHAFCLVLYPHNPHTFCLPRARSEFHHLVRCIATVGKETVLVYCLNEEQAALASLEFEKDDNIVVEVCPSNDTWARDTAPTFLVVEQEEEPSADTDNGGSSSRSTQKLVGLDWEFNAYGGPDLGLYWPCTLDQQVARNMCMSVAAKLSATNKKAVVEHRKIPLVLEGGSIHTDGQGTLLTTAECLLHPSRNPDKTQQEIESSIFQATGCTKAIWLPFGVDGDSDTTGHIDNWACFVKPQHVVLSWTDDDVHDKVNYERCRQALEILNAATDAQGRSLTVHKLSLPSPPLYYTQEQVDSIEPSPDGSQARHVGERMAASYVNFYIANAAILVPQYGNTEYDDKAVETLQELFPDRTAVGVPSLEILIGGGNIHCQTQQVPEIVL